MDQGAKHLKECQRPMGNQEQRLLILQNWLWWNPPILCKLEKQAGSGSLIKYLAEGRKMPVKLSMVVPVIFRRSCCSLNDKFPPNSVFQGQQKPFWSDLTF